MNLDWLTELSDDVRSTVSNFSFENDRDLVALVSFALITLFSVVAFRMLFGKRRSADDYESLKKIGPAFGPLTRPLASAIPMLGGEQDRTRLDLSRAGYYKPSALIDYLATRNVLVILVLIGFGTLAVIGDPNDGWPETFLVLGAIIAALGYALPGMILHSQATARLKRVEHALPDALDMTTMCLSGGVSLNQAVDRVSREIRFSHPDIALEFHIIRRQADADSMPRALRNFANRFDSPDVNSLAALVTHTERMGTHVATAITEFADGMRTSRRQRVEERANRASVALLFPVILCLAPPMYVLLAGPPLLRLRSFILDENKPGGVLDPGTTIRENGAPPSLNRPQ